MNKKKPEAALSGELQIDEISLFDRIAKIIETHKTRTGAYANREVNNDHINYGTILSEHRRTWWAFIMFMVFFLIPFFYFFSLTLYTIGILVIGRQYETINLFLLLFFGGFAVWFAYWMKPRFFGIYYSAIYEKGLLVKNHFGEQFITWEMIEDARPVLFGYRFFLFVTIFWRTLTIKHRDGVVVIESGTGFTFSDWFLLFALHGYSDFGK